MLKLYRRHNESCGHAARSYTRCRCKIWVQGSLNGRPVRQAMDMSSWEDASRKIREWETGVKPPENISTKDGISRFLEDAKARNLSPATLGKLRLVLEKQLLPFCDARNITLLNQISVIDLISFRASWKDSPLSAVKKFERLRSFFLFCDNNGWSGNPCKGLKPPKAIHNPTLPFTDEEVGKILEACDLFSCNGRFRAVNRNRVRAMVLLLRYSGLRIRDAVSLERKKIQNGRLLLRTAKTGTHVFLPLPDFVVKELESLNHFPDRFFWNGGGKIESAVGVWERTMKRLFEIAQIEGGHCHRFRDTMSVHLLQNGVPLDSVAAILGNTARIVEKHYAPWVQSRQIQLEEFVKKTW